MKRCPRCAATKSLNEFGPNRCMPDGLSVYCRPCHNEIGKTWRQQHSADVNARRRARYQEDPGRRRLADRAWRAANPDTVKNGKLKQYYGIDLETYRKMLAAQNNVCAICGLPSTKALHVDHDHECCPGNRSCGQCIRALLCDACNTGLGLLRDSETVLASALEYVRVWAKAMDRK